MDAGTYVRVRSIFFGVSVVFAYWSTHYALGGVAGLLVPRKKKEAQEKAYAEFIGGGTYRRVRSFFFTTFLVFSVPFREDTDSCWSGYSSGSF